MDTFPNPFGGIEYAIQLDDIQLAEAVRVLTFCHLTTGHRHNFAVQRDGNVIHASELGMQCLQEAGIIEE